jgi:hypothetical protein
MALDNIELLEQQHLESQEVLNKILEILSAKTELPAPVVNVAAPIVNVPAPVVNIEEKNVTLNQDKVVNAVSDMADKIVKDLKYTPPAAEEKPLSKWVVDVLRNEDGNIVSMNFNQIK